ncbi:MAG: hypothetical protein ACI31E_06115 [Muribaculaceae bacterium]
MNEFCINVHVTVDVADRLHELLSALRGAPVLNEPQPACAVEAAAAIEAPADEASAAAIPEAATAAPAAVMESEAPAEKEYTLVDVREAIDRTRLRIEGEDWLNANSAGRLRWHEPLNAWFRLTAAHFGAEKPSWLPDSESRRLFIAECDRVTVEDDSLVVKCPF